MSRSEKRRRRHLARAAERRAAKPAVSVVKTPSEPEPVKPPFERTTWGGKGPHESGNVETQWKPGDVPNPNGYSRGRRIGDAICRIMDAGGWDEKIATTAIMMAMGTKPKDRDPHLGWFRELRDMVDGKVPKVTVLVKPPDDVAVNVAVATTVETNVHGIDPAVAERIMAAAEPDVTIDEGDETT